MTPTPHTDHAPGHLCPAGTRLYERALQHGHLTTDDANEAPCLLDTGLLHPALENPDRLQPVAPAIALQRLLRYTGERIAEERRREEQLAEVFQSLVRVGEASAEEGGTPLLSVLSGKDRINQAITEALAGATEELLSVQPQLNYHSSAYAREAQALAMRRDQALLDRGGRIRALYAHTQRHIPVVVSRYEQLRGDAQARTLDEVTERLIIVDRTVAFIPADRDRAMALEIRHPALVGYLTGMFDRFWRLATPMYPQAVQPPSINGITARQRAIAELLIEGHTDTVIAERLGMNVRTARVHIAKLAATLGSQSRAQLGYLIGRSGILDQAR
ncbi:LuxR C-terminal-related transcriptional regulator [Streptomyces sp. 15-116A]|uniref:helix-turn-helix transcriptional regulator n=1 Tax=Streptomyces sp. 15-116A TaxID=2259035 RepID=UPI0021B1859C|nr:LuxR C-terminal-related transcriptional regulator [Streptomyces sp. 15-116A]MCT7354855.1 LuxR C-terminal-related transcriptional regulator [Streptomyces sp. 15-116A]